MLAHVLRREEPPFRPRLDRALCSVELYNLMERCWEEDPAARPTFKEVRTEMRGISKYVQLDLVLIVS